MCINRKNKSALSIFLLAYFYLLSIIVMLFKKMNRV